MGAAIVHHHAQVLHRVAGNSAGLQGLAYAFLHCGNELVGNGAALHRIDEVESGPARQRLHSQKHFAELPGAAGLLLVAVMAVGAAQYRFAVGHTGRMGFQLHVVLALHPLQHHAQMQFTQAVEHSFVERGHMFQAQARIFRQQLVQGVRQLLLVAVPRRGDGHALHRRRPVGRGQVVMVFVVRVVHHRVEMQFLDLADGADIAGDGRRDLLQTGALQPIQVGRLERLARVADVQLGAGLESALMHAQHADAPLVGIDADLEHVRHGMQGVVRNDIHRHGGGALALDEGRRIGLDRVGQQAQDQVEQFGHAGAAQRGSEADRDQMPLAQSLLERIVQLLRADRLVAAEVALQQPRIHFDHLFDDAAVRFLHRGEIGVRPLAGKEAVQHPLAAFGRQVDRQAGGAESFLQVAQQLRQVDSGLVDLVDDDDTIQPAPRGCLGHAPGGDVDAALGVDHDHRRFHRRQHRLGAAQQVEVAGRVDQVDVPALTIEVTDGAIERVPQFLFMGIGVADGGAARQFAHAGGGARAVQQRFRQQGLARAGLAEQGQIADICGGIGHIQPSSRSRDSNFSGPA